MTQSMPIQPPTRKTSIGGPSATTPISTGAAAPTTRSGRRVSMSSDRLGLGSLSERGTPTFSPYPQSLPTSQTLKKDGSSDGSSAGGNTPLVLKKKARRPSELAAVLCQHCGKNYKHQQCLVKHLWEHSPYWTTIPETSQPLSKHQRVQLLEGASILFKMGSPGGNEGGVTDPTAIAGSSLAGTSVGAGAGLFNGPPGISPSPFGTSASLKIESTAAGVLEDDDDEDDDEDDDDEDDEDSSPGPTNSSSPGRQDDDEMRDTADDTEEGIFGKMEQ
ncbi:hypothetical protein PYCC9005_002697 [Savitreella phatthalungensis]